MNGQDLLIAWALIFTAICAVCSLDYSRLRDWQRKEIGPFADSHDFRNGVNT